MKRLKNSFCYILLLILIDIFSPLNSFSLELTPYADGTHLDCTCSCCCSMVGCGMYCQPCEYTDVIITESIAVHEDCMPGDDEDCTNGGWFQLNHYVAVLEFNISSARALFEPDNVKATLGLTVENVSTGTGDIYLWNTKDEYENGSIDLYSGSVMISTASYTTPLQPGDIVTFDVTDAVKHDLFDSGQSDYSGFSLSTNISDEINCTFYNHTYPGYSPKLLLEKAYSLSGWVTLGLRKEPLPEVSMTLSGDISRTTSTDPSGYYVFSGLSNGTYKIVPSKNGYRFFPSSRDITINGATVSDQNFRGRTSLKP